MTNHLIVDLMVCFICGGISLRTIGLSVLSGVNGRVTLGVGIWEKLWGTTNPGTKRMGT